MKPRTAGSLALLLFTLGAISGLGGCGDRDKPEKAAVRPVLAIQAGDVEALDNTYLPGRTRAAQEVELSFRVAGTLSERPVKIGDPVRAGDLVARLDPRDFEVEVQSAEGSLDEAKAALAQAQANLNRLLGIQKKDPGATSQKAIDQAREDRDRARAGIKTAEASLQAAKDRLEYTELKAPFDGNIVATHVENFTSVLAKQAIVRLLDTSEVKFDVDVPERYMAAIPRVEDIRVFFDTHPDLPVPARIHEVGQEASATTRTFRVTLMVEQPKEFQVLAGMAGRVIAKSDSPEGGESQAILLPVTAVFAGETPDQSHVWVVDADTRQVHKRRVSARELKDTGIAIDQGLTIGEWVVTAGVHFLNEGQEVRILEQEGASKAGPAAETAGSGAEE